MRPSQFFKIFMILPLVILTSFPAMATDGGDTVTSNSDSGPSAAADSNSPNNGNGGSNGDAAVNTGDVSNALSVYDHMTCNRDKKAPTPYKNPQDILNAVQNYETQANGCVPDNFAAFKKELQVYGSEYMPCVQRAYDANMMCLENCSKDVANMVAGANVLMGSLRGSGIVDACSKMNKVMNVVQGGLTAFSANCSIRRALCDNSCTATEKSITSMNKMLQSMNGIGLVGLKSPQCGTPGTPSDRREVAYQALTEMLNKVWVTLQKEASKEEPNSIAEKNAKCGSYAATALAAGAAIIGAVAAAKNAASCNQDTNGVGSVDTRAMCAKSENKNQPTCICQANPRSPGCSLATSYNASGSGGGFASPSTNKSTSQTPLSNLNSDLNANAATASKNGDASSGLAGAPSGGGGGFGGSGGGSGGDNKANPDTVKKINTSIFGGGDGGGGGGYGSGGSGADKSVDPVIAGKIKAQRELASLRSQVSSQGGKSNWEKVQERYTQEKPKLIGQ
jgi:hypothetical protein